jgi:hypothetical protein
MRADLMDARDVTEAALDAADLTVLLGLVRRAKTGAERRWQKRHHLNHDQVGGDPAQTKVHKLGRLFAKLEALRSHVP